jgi:hypothetical protein
MLGTIHKLPAESLLEKQPPSTTDYTGVSLDYSTTTLQNMSDTLK